MRSAPGRALGLDRRRAGAPGRPQVPLEGRALSILHLVTRLERGGSSDCTLWQALGAARRRHRVTVVSGPAPEPSPLVERARREGLVRFLEIPQLVRRPDPRRDLYALLAIVRLLRREPFDIIHTHTSKAGALGRLAALLVGRRGAVVHQPHGHLFYGYYGRTRTALVTTAERLLAPLARVQVALSWRGAEEHLCRGIGRPGRFVAIRSGIDLRPFRHASARRGACRARLAIGPDEVVVGSLCRLEAIKGPGDLVAGFARASLTRPRLRLLIAGDGPLRGSLLARAEAAGLRGRVTITGRWEAPEEFLPALDLFVLASRNEGMGRALVEAMACGLPVVACAVGGVPEVLEEGRAGLLIPPSDPEAIGMAIGRLADAPELAALMGRRARARAIAFGAGRMVRSLLRLYREVASDPREEAA
ncbi:MAG: glycosyltransferase [Acidobacteriota bacterium]